MVFLQLFSAFPVYSEELTSCGADMEAAELGSSPAAARLPHVGVKVSCERSK